MDLKEIEKEKRINRNDRFCNSVKKKDVICVLSGLDAIQCEAAHIVPLNGDYGQVNFINPKLLNDSANGMLLSKELHFLYDQFIWSINPNDYTETDSIPKKRIYNIDIVSNYKNKNVSINNFNNITLRADCHHFIEVAYSIFLNFWNPNEINFKKLEVKSNSVFKVDNMKILNKKMTTIDKLENNVLLQLQTDLNEIIVFNKTHNKNFNKKSKLELASKYNLHEQSIDTYHKQLKKEYIKRITY